MDLTIFRSRLGAYLRPAGHSQQELARVLGMHPSVLSHKLHGTDGARLVRDEITGIVRALADWQAITSRAEAAELLALAGLPGNAFSAAEWLTAPLGSLEEDAGASPAAPAGRAAGAGGAGALPAPLTPLVGRGEEVRQVRGLLAGEARLVTLTGVGGTGKTRLALQAAAELAGAYADGARFVDLAPIHDPALVPGTIAAQLGLEEDGPGRIEDRLLAHVRDQHLLVLLDNFEQVLVAAPLVAALLRAAPRLRVLLTSRVPLRLSGEHEVRVPPLGLAPAGSSADQVLASEAVQLFVQRARAVRADFVPTPETAPLLSEICRRLDGLPLAIELAATRVRHLPLEVLLLRLESRLQLLDRGPRDMPERQRTLRATLDWSYALLSAAEQRLFAALGVFVGGCTPEAAAFVCSAADSVDDQLWDLVDSALLDRIDAGSGAGEPLGAPRFRMLETLREYALARLAESGEATRVRARHAHYFLELAERTEPELAGPHQGEWLEHLEREHDNLRAALEWYATTDCESEARLRLAASLDWFWHLRGHVGEGFGWTEAALTQHPGAATAARAKALFVAGRLAWVQGNHTLARRRLEESMAICQELGDRRGRAHALVLLGLILQPPAGARLSPPTVLEEAAAVFRGLQDTRGLAIAVQALGLAAFHRGDHATASARFEECLALSHQLGDAWFAAQALDALGDLARGEGDDAGAAALYEKSLGLLRAQHLQAGVPSLLHNLAHVALRQGDAGRAVRLFQESLGLFRGQGDQRGMAECLAGLAGVLGTLGLAERAARLFGAAEVLLPAETAPRYDANAADYARHVALVSAQLDKVAFAKAWAEGRAAPVAEVLAEVLTDVDVAGTPNQRTAAAVHLTPSTRS